MKARFFLANPKADKCSLDAIVTYNGIRYKKGIGVSVETKYWSADRQLASINQRYRDGVIVNHHLKMWGGAIDRAVRKMELEDLSLDKKDFWRLVDCEINGTTYTKSNSGTAFLVDYIENIFIPNSISLKSDTRVRRFNVVLAKLKDFENHSFRHYTFEDVNVSFYRDLQSYMNGLGHSANYFGTIIKVVKQIMREAHIVGKLHNNDEYTHSEFKAISQDVDNVYLTIEELDVIHRKPIDEDFVKIFYPRAQYSSVKGIIRSYNIVKSRFLIGAYTGLRFSDFNRIDRDNIGKGTISVVTEKTDQKIVIPIHPVVREILDSGFDLSLSLSDTKSRAYIKDICRYAGIDEVVEVRESIGGKIVVNRYPKYKLVGTHTARRSFATNAYKAGIPTISIMKITGHTKESSFMRYIRISQEENAVMLSQHPFFM